MKPIDFTKTERGFARGEFQDRYGSPCSIQKSSLAGEDCLWLGCDELILTPPDGELANGRIHLTQERAKELIPILKRFVKTGELIPPSDTVVKSAPMPGKISRRKALSCN